MDAGPPAAPDGRQIAYHRLFGLTLASLFPFRSNLPPGEPPAELSFELLREPAEPAAADAETVFASPHSAASGKPSALLLRRGALEILRFPDLFEFLLEERRIRARLLDPSAEALLEIRLLGSVFAYLLERQGILALHASAVTGPGGSRAVAFLAGNSAGKSSLAAALMQRGARLVSDDLLPVETLAGGIRVRPAYPEIRMWPDQVEHFLGTARGLPRVHPALSKRRVAVSDTRIGGFRDEPAPLAAIVLPSRGEGAFEGPLVDLRRLPHAAAFKELLRHSFSPLLVEAVGLQPRRLEAMARLVREVPAYRLTYAPGFESLAAVAAALEGRLASL